jgi:two-component system, NtrC family, response regulator GlrR
MGFPAVVFVHSNDSSCLPSLSDAGPISAVLEAVGGRSFPLSVTSGMQNMPTVAIIHETGWPRWPEALRTIRTMWHQSAIMGILEEGTVSSPSLRNALSADLSDFLCTPVRESELHARVIRLLDLTPKRDEWPELQVFKAQHQLESLLGQSEVFARTLHRIPPLAAADVPVLIVGETGTGKELVARALHYCGRRRHGPFVPFNCGALPDHLFENELFGHVPGAYTDARAEQKGLLSVADGGTLFLDEADSLSLNAQVKLLRLLQDKEYRPLGSAQVHHADVRVLAATNVKLEDLVARRLFREDLFHRLNVLQISLPPLRERTCDVAELAQAFLRRFCAQIGRPALKFSARAFQTLESYRWPGNVRELESVVQRAAILAESSVIDAPDLELPEADKHTATTAAFEQAKRRAIDGFQRSYLTQLLAEVDGNVSRAARQAGKDRRTFQRLLHKCNLNAADYHH